MSGDVDDKKMAVKLEKRLVNYEELPEYLKDNEFIRDYYRCEWPLNDVFLSVFSLHNETQYLDAFDRFCDIFGDDGDEFDGDDELRECDLRFFREVDAMRSKLEGRETEEDDACCRNSVSAKQKPTYI